MIAIATLFLLFHWAGTETATVYDTSSPQASSDSAVHRVNEPGISAPKVKYTSEPEYTEEARRNHIEGTVIIHAIIGQDGKIHDPVVKKSLGHGLDEEAIVAVKRWAFVPAKKNGSPVSVFVDISVTFRLRT